MWSAPWKKFWKQFWVFSVRAENFSATPLQKCIFWGVRKFLPKLIFGRKSDFWSFCHLCTPKWGGCDEKCFFQKFSPGPKLFGKKSQKGLEWVFAPQMHIWNFKSFCAKIWYFGVFWWYCRYFWGRKCGLWVRGGRKIFGSHRKYPKVFPKKFSWCWPHFGTLWASKSPKMP